MSNFSEPVVDVVVPTFNNEGVLYGCLSTLLGHTMTPYRAYVVNNGDKDISYMVKSPLFEFHDTGKNLGWMGGVNYGVRLGKSKYILMLNDDTQIIDHQSGWLNSMVSILEKNPDVGVVVPMSNQVMHLQNMFVQNLPRRFSVGFVSGFCLLVRRDVFERLGGLDESLYGGDDIDFSIRVRDLGYKLVVMRDVFVFHRGYVTGRKLYGNHWNSLEYKDKVDGGLIRKHGFKKWVETVTTDVLEIECGQREEDFETQVIMKYIDTSKKILDVGCGSRKIVPEATGVDIVSRGTTSYNPTQITRRSQADICADFTEIPVEDESYDIVHSRHTLEHITDVVACLKEWKRILKKGGTMILALPDEEVCPGIPLDPTHLHSFTKQSIASLLDVIGGFEVIHNETPRACYSFVCVARKAA